MIIFKHIKIREPLNQKLINLIKVYVLLGVEILPCNAK